MAAKKIKVSIQTKLVLVFFIFILVVTALMLYSTKRQTLEAMRDELTKLAVIISTQVDGDALAALKPGDENGKAYKALHAKLFEFQEAHPDIKYVYTFRKHNDKLVEFIVDPSYGSDDGEKIGNIYEETTAEMYNGLKEPVADKDVVADENGIFLSGYAPIKDSKGANVGGLGVDMEMSIITEKVNELAKPVLLAIAVALLFAMIVLAYVTMSMIKDIRALTKEANEISRGNTSGMINIKRNDEIGDLADSFSRMTASLKILMMSDEDDRDKKG